MNRGHPGVVFGALGVVLVLAFFYAAAVLADWPLTLPYEHLRDADLAAGVACALGAAFVALRPRGGKLE